MRFAHFLLASLGLLAGIGGSQASSHSEAPGTSKRPARDATDVFAFRSYEVGREAYTTLMVNYNPLQDPFGGPNYFALDQETTYEINIDQDGDAEEDLTFQFVIHNELAKNDGLALNIGGKNIPVALKYLGPITTPDDPDLNFFEFYRVNLIDHRKGKTKSLKRAGTDNESFQKPSDNVGTKTFPNYEAYASQFYYNVDIPNCNDRGKVFVGQRAEPFNINIGPIFDLISIIPIDGATFPGGIIQDTRNNMLRGKSITTFALEVPTECLTQGRGNGVIGVWTSNRKDGEQTGRLANPLVNELLIGLVDKDSYNKAHPKDDKDFQDYIHYPTLPEIISILFKPAVAPTLATIAPTNLPRKDLEAVFLTGITGLNAMEKTKVKADMVRLNTAIAPTSQVAQNSLGVIKGDNAGFPNGRRPADDVIDIALLALMGRLCNLNLICTPADAPVGGADITDGSPGNALQFRNTFPYFNTPLPGNGPLIA